jgi:hypothetical protein
MVVMTTDRFPMNRWLPQAPLIDPIGYNRNVRVGPPYMAFEEAIVDPKDIAATIDNWATAEPSKLVQELSLAGRDWANANSWEQLGPEYEAALAK